MVDYTPRLKEKYQSEIRANLKKEYSYSNDMMIPKLQKIVLNMGVGEAVGDSKKMHEVPIASIKIATIISKPCQHCCAVNRGK